MQTICVGRAQAITVLSSTRDMELVMALRTELGRDSNIVLVDEVFTDSAHLLARIRREHPDVVLLDIRCSFYREALRQIQECERDARVVLVCDRCTDLQIAEQIIQGVRGCLPRSASPALWRKAISRVYAGEIWANRSIVLDVMASLAAGPGEGSPEPHAYHELLTGREVEVARLVGLGMTNKEIARTMTISDTTVKTHLKHIFSKLKVTRRAHLNGSGGSRH